MVPLQFLFQLSSHLRPVRSIMGWKAQLSGDETVSRRAVCVVKSLGCWEMHSGLDPRGSAKGSLECWWEEPAGLGTKDHSWTSFLSTAAGARQPGNQGLWGQSGFSEACPDQCPQVLSPVHMMELVCGWPAHSSCLTSSDIGFTCCWAHLTQVSMFNLSFI